jgi:small-conductance mechanosensitive channel
MMTEFFPIIKAVILVIAGFILAPLCSRAAQRLIDRYTSTQHKHLLYKIIYFTVIILFMVCALQQLGFKLSVLLGSAGIITAALAIAAQNSISNIISGLFLIVEKSLQIGDQIKVGTHVGTITAIDLLCVKILTTNNTLIRIPNDTLIKSELTNLTRFESRRLDLTLKVAAKEDIKKVKELLFSTLNQSKQVQKSPLPSIAIHKVDNSGIAFILSVWVSRDNYDHATDNLLEDIIPVLQTNNIQL